MLRPLVVEFRVPVGGWHSDRGTVIQFHRWLPRGTEQGIAVEREGISLLIYFDDTCIAFPHKTEDINIERHFNVGIDTILVRASTILSDDQLASYIETVDPAEAPGASPLGDEYNKLGRKLTRLSAMVLNQLVAYLRAEKGHYWLQYYDEFQPGGTPENYEGRAHFENGEWFRWRPSNVISLRATLPSEDNCVSADDWTAVREAVSNERFRAWPAGLLLADAFLLRGHAYRRAALVEACAALEIALARFLEAPLTDELFNPERALAVNVQNLISKSRSQEIGLRISVNLLIPMIFPARIIDNQLISDVQNAVEKRNLVVHRGARKLDSTEVQRYLRSIKTLCGILRQYTRGEAARRRRGTKTQSGPAE